ncbi:MAG: glycosyltransferase [Thermodesulfobacteriota bacterium]
MQEQGPPLTVLHVTWSFMTGGLERLVLDFLRLGPEMGLRPRLAVLTQAGDLAQQVRDLGVPLAELGKRSGLDFRLVPRLVRLLRSQGVQVIHAHNQGAMLYAGLAGLLSGRPMVATRHGTSRWAADRPADTSYRLLSRLVGRLARVTVCVGRDSLRVAREVDRLPERRLRLIYNGVDPDLFPHGPQVREQARCELGLPAGAPLVLSVGRLSPEKDQAGLLRACALLRERFPELRLIILGEGGERPALTALATELGLGQALALPGNRDDVPRYLAAADVFTLSSLSEGISVSLLEAMAAGLPVVATLVGGNPEVVQDGASGLLVPARSPEALAQALGRVLSEPELAAALGQAARERVQAHFSLRRMMQEYADIYRQLAAGPGGGR